MVRSEDVRSSRDALFRRLRLALAPFLLRGALEVALGLAGLVVVLRVLAGHAAEPSYAVVVGTLAAFVLATTALSAALLVKALTLDGDEPAATLQRRVERLRLAEYRAAKWAVLGSALVWLPGALVLFEAATGVAALERVALPWFLGNLFLGIDLLVIGQALSKEHVERADPGPRARALVDAVSSRALRRTAAALAELARSEREVAAARARS